MINYFILFSSAATFNVTLSNQSITWCHSIIQFNIIRFTLV